MTIDAPMPPQASTRTRPSLIRRLVSYWHYAWSDLRSLPHRNRQRVALQPFSFWPGHASALVENAGQEPPLVPGYAFHTNYVQSSGGRIRFLIRFPGLEARTGSLLLSINRLDGLGVLRDSRTRQLPLAEIARAGGETEISMRGRLDCSYAVMGAVTADSDARADQVEIDMIGGEPREALNDRFDIARRTFLAAPGTGPLASHIVQRPATLAEPLSQMCTAAQMDEPAYEEWCRRMGMARSPHRKQWEYVFIARALEYYGALREGARGVGFGIGQEPLPSVFAAAGCQIVATDLAAADDRAQAWNDTAQLGTSLRDIYQPHLCDEATFFERVSYRAVDMTAIPADLTGFDFTWSSCAYEHLGSIDAGLDFFENSLACLKPGGLAVHTTELNLSSNDQTLDSGATVIFRRRDFERLAARLIRQGHQVIPITFDSGDAELDRVIDLPPYVNDPHLRLALLRWVATSFGMIVRKKA
ncbi:hypothetical protein ASE00_10245 [Sphingomonas sp. Root710]|uniref:SAM-dependent methyltransferase n=1 Tax=Sphingomonas sp. Root710 TaxID=1736594 RepID=UPI0006F747E2|nr:class I SAM-dependent methyltransferase [Sphingomonas sp. Root710]KRB82434.1 hypothetical protein ASE00_10245 [Sphingomonas sp. Root710]